MAYMQASHSFLRPKTVRWTRQKDGERVLSHLVTSEMEKSYSADVHVSVMEWYDMETTHSKENFEEKWKKWTKHARMFIITKDSWHDLEKNCEINQRVWSLLLYACFSVIIKRNLLTKKKKKNDWMATEHGYIATE